VFIYATPLESMKGVLSIGALSASNLFGPKVAGLFAALMAASIMATVNAMVTIGPRVYYAMAHRKAFFARAASVHQLFARLGEKYPALAPHLAQGLAVAIDGQIYQDALLQEIGTGSEVHILPQIAGG